MVVGVAHCRFEKDSPPKKMVSTGIEPVTIARLFVYSSISTVLTALIYRTELQDHEHVFSMASI